MRIGFSYGKNNDSFHIPRSTSIFTLVFYRAVSNEGASPHPLEIAFTCLFFIIIMSELIKLVEATNENRTSEFPVFSSGDTIVVHVKIREGAKERLQLFQGTVLQRRNPNSCLLYTSRCV